MSPFRRILHPSDFSPASRPAFARALDLAKANRAQLFVVHVLGPIVAGGGEGYVPPRLYEELEASARAYAQKQLDTLTTKAKKAGVRARGLLLTGIPHEQITRAAESRRADLIVIGTHGRTGFARLLLGSVAARVVAIAPCPVLTVRGK